MKILMTGATGFLGSHLLSRFLTEPDAYQITLLKRSFSDTWRIADQLSHVRCFDVDRIDLQEILDADRYDTILHCATDYGRKEIPRSAMIESNLLLPLRLLDGSIARGIRNFVNTDTLLDKRVSAYAMSKRQFREWLESSANSIGATTVLLEHFYGPGDDPTKFVTQIVRALLDNAPSIPMTLGDQRRDFIYIDDVVEAFMKILGVIQHGGCGYAEYEVGSGNSISIREFVELAKSECHNAATQLDFGALPYRVNEPMNVQVKSSCLRALGWRPTVNLEDGIRKTIEFERKFLV